MSAQHRQQHGTLTHRGPRLAPLDAARRVVVATVVMGAFAAHQVGAQGEEAVIVDEQVDPNAHQFPLSSKNLARHFSLSRNLHTVFDFAEDFVAVRVPKFLLFLTVLVSFIVLACVLPPALSEILRRFRVPPNYRSALQFVLELGLVGIGLVVALAAIDIDAMGIITSLAFASVLLGLAAQLTLNNIFSGIAIRSNPRLVMGQEISIHQWRGEIKEVGFMSVLIELEDGDVVMVQNSSFGTSDVVFHKDKPPLIVLDDDEETSIQVRAHRVQGAKES